MEVLQDLTLSSLRVDPLTDNASVDALTVEGPVSLTKTLAVTGELTAPVMKAPVENGDAALTVTEALHAGTIVMQTDVSSDRTYTIPAPSAAGVTYKFVGQGSGSAADGHDIILSTAATGTVFFDGMITFLDTDDNEVSGIWANGSSHDQLQINVPAGYSLTLVAKSTTVYYITGTVTSATAPAFSAP